MRLRSGRGGRLHVDRRFHVSRPHLLQRERATHPLQREEIAAMHEHHERWAPRGWRPLEADFKLRRGMPELGEVYFKHPSIYHSQNEDSMDVDDQEGQFDTSFDSERNPQIFDRPNGSLRPSETNGVRSMQVRSNSEAAMSDKIQEVEAWRGLAAESVSGGALALFTDGGGEQMDQIARDAQNDSDEFMDLSGDNLEHAWRIDDRWRYDENVYHEESDDRFIMDDFQAKYLRVSISLLDSNDHDMLKIDPHLLPPIPAKPSRYLDHHLRQSGLAQLSSIPHRPHIPARIQPPPQPLASQNSLPKNDVTPIRTPTQVNGRVVNGVTDHQQHQTSPTQNGPTSVPASGARLPPDSGPVARISSLTRQKQQTPNGIVSLQTPSSPENPGGVTQPSTNGTGSYTTAATNGVSAVVKSNDVAATPHIPSQQLAGRPGANDSSPDRSIGVPLGVGNLQLKLPSQQNGVIGNSIPGRSTPGFHNTSPMYWPPNTVDLTNTFY